MQELTTSISLNEQFLAKIAGWEVIKQARAALAGGRVLSSNWASPVLKGVVQEGTTSYRAGLVIKDAINIDNLCTCRTAKAWGAMCVHSIAVGLHHLQKSNPTSPAGITASEPQRKTSLPAGTLKPERTFKRVKRSAKGWEAEVALVFPPNFTQALAKGKVMLYAEAIWSKGRTPLNVLVNGEEYQFNEEDARLLDALENVAGDTPGMFVAGPDQLVTILRAGIDHPGVTFGKAQK